MLKNIRNQSKLSFFIFPTKSIENLCLLTFHYLVGKNSKNLFILKYSLGFVIKNNSEFLNITIIEGRRNYREKDKNDQRSWLQDKPVEDSTIGKI